MCAQSWVETEEGLVAGVVGKAVKVGELEEAEEYLGALEAGLEGMAEVMAVGVAASAAGAAGPEELEEDSVVREAGLEGPEEEMVDRVVAEEAGVAVLEARAGVKVNQAEA